MDVAQLQGTNQPVQTEVPVNTSLYGDGSNSSNPYNAGFWDWLQSVSGINFYKNLFGGWKDNPGNSFWDFISTDPKSGYNFMDTYKNFIYKGRLGDTVMDIVGADDPTSYDNDPYNDLPDELYDIFKQGVELFKSNVANQESYNSQEAERNRLWEEYMSNTAYQRAMADMIIIIR